MINIKKQIQDNICSHERNKKKIRQLHGKYIMLVKGIKNIELIIHFY